jgi:hypothetical protein
VQQRQNAIQLDLLCGGYRVRLMSPRLVSDEWARWLADPQIMLPRGFRPRAANKQQLAQYVMRQHANQRAIVGIFDAASDRHLGILEMSFDRKHLIALVDLTVDTHSESLARVAEEVMPRLLTRISNRFGVEKYVAQLPETNTDALAYFSSSDWVREAELKDEVPGPEDGSRLNVVQFAWFPPQPRKQSTRDVNGSPDIGGNP